MRGRPFGAPVMCDHVWISWTTEWETIAEGVQVPVLVRRCALCPAVEYANRQPVAA